MASKINKLKEDIIQLTKHANREIGKKEKLEEDIVTLKEEVKSLNNKIDLLEKVSVIFQLTSEYARKQAKNQIETLVTNCLQYVFENEIELNIDIDELYNRANAEFYVTTKDKDLIIKNKPELSRGGGVVDIISLALRIAFLQIHKPKIEGPLILDEPAKHVSEEFIYNVADFLKRTSEVFNRQVILVTHNNHLASIGSTCYRVELKGSISQVEKIDQF